MKRFNQSKRMQRWSGMAITLLVLLSMLACNLPYARPSETPQVDVTRATATEAEKVNYPPTVVETDPLPMSVIGVDGAISLTFSQPMEHQSVEGALSLEPALGGKFEWQDDWHVTFTPDKALPAATNVKLSVANTATAVNGLKMQEGLEFDFVTAEPLRVAQNLPVGTEIDPTSAVIAVFNQPVVALGAESADLPAAFVIEPAVEGVGEWLNTSTYIFYPQPSFEGGTTYTVRITPGLVSTAGTTLADESVVEWEFSSAQPRVLEVIPTAEDTIPLDTQFVIRFNQRMDATATEGAILVTGDGGLPVDGAIEWNEGETELTFIPSNLLSRNSANYLVIGSGAQGVGGAVLQNPQQHGFVTVPELELVDSQPTSNDLMDTYSGFGSFSLLFSAPLKEAQDFSAAIIIEPEVDGLYINAYDRRLYVSGYFQPSTTYTVSVNTALVDRWNGELVDPFTYTVTTKPLPAAIMVPMVRAAGAVVHITPWDARIAAEVNNVRQINASRAALSVEEFIQWMGAADMLDLFEPDEAWSQGVGGDLNQKQQVDLKLSSGGGALKTGLYGLRYVSTDITDSYMSARFYAVVSRVQLTMKTSPKQIFVWAVNLEDETPIADLPIAFYDSDNNLIGQATTNERGVAVNDLDAPLEAYASYYAVAEEPGNALFGLARSDMTYGISPWRLGIDLDTSTPKTQMYLYTDRPIYQPGQMLYFRGTLRYPENGRYLLPADAPQPINEVNLEFSGYTFDGADSGWKDELSLPISEFGSFDGSVELPESLVPGYYSIRATNLEGWQSIGFQVAEYRKPEVEVELKFSQDEVLAGTDLNASGQANYYFGAAAANLPVEWSLYARDGYFYLPGYRVGKTRWDWRFSNYSNYVGGGQGVTDGQGTFELTIHDNDFMAEIDPEVMTELTLEVTVRDESGLPVSTRQEVIRHPSAFYIGVRSDAWNGEAGEELGFDIFTVNWDQKASGNHSLTANFMKVEWVEGEIDPSTGDTQYERVTTLIDSLQVSVDASGKGRVTFTPPDPGVYLLEMRSGNAVTEYSIWVMGAGVAQWPRISDDSLQLQADAETYEPGDEALINIPNPYEGDTLALVTVERGNVMRSEVLTIEEAVYQYALPIGEDDAPNIYFTVMLIESARGSKPSFRYGAINLNVDRAGLLMQVTLTPDPEKTTPGGQAAYHIKVVGPDGEPVEGEFSLAVVDKALLALSDTNSQAIEDAYYGTQPLGVLTATSLAINAGRIKETPIALGRGGGGGDMAAESSTQGAVREDFRDTAYWIGSVVTDSSGEADVLVTLPDNLTTWVAEVRGVSTNLLVGSALAEVVVSKDLLVRPVTPRFAVVGDHLELAAVVHNNTANALDVQASLQAAGFTLDDEATAVQSFALDAGGAQRVNWWGTVDDVDDLDLVFSARGGDFSDSTRPTYGKLPVLHYSSPQTFGTSGLMTGAGERLEVVSLPTSFTPTGGKLTVELTPSLASVILSELAASDAYEYDYSEAILSRLLPNIETYRILKEANINAPELKTRLETAVQDGLERLVRLQNEDGGWSWIENETSQVWLTAYVVFGLGRAQQADLFVPNDVIEKGQTFLESNQPVVTDQSSDEEIDQCAFVLLALLESGYRADAGELYPYYERMSPAGQAMLALGLHKTDPGSENLRTLSSDLQSGAIRSATGAYWEDTVAGGWYRKTANTVSGIVVYALAQVDPASSVLPEAVRYLVAHRKALRGWGSTYENAWVLMALGEYMRGTGDFRPVYSYGAALNGETIAGGEASGVETVTPVTTSVPLDDLQADEPNGLVISRTSGNGSLFYRAFLQVDRPVEDVEPINRGVSISRAYYAFGEDCKMPDCTPIEEMSLSAENTQVMARISVTVPHDLYYAVIEDYMPAGMEVLDLSLKTTQQGSGEPVYLADDPYKMGWGWWWFSGPRIYDERVQWSAQYLAAGTYELTYRMIPVAAGEFRTLPAHGWEYYFPEVEGSSAGSIFSVTP